MGHCPRTTPIRLMAVIACFSIVLAACGSDSEDAERPSQPVEASLSTSTTVPEATASTTVGTGQSPSAPTTTGAVDPSGPTEGYEPVFTPGPCPFQRPPGTDPTCGRLTVPENRAQPAGPQVELAVAIFPARSEDEFPPVVYLEGGPGGEALEALPFSHAALFEFLDQKRTVIVFDQRGVGYSTPSLSCPELLDFTYDLLDEDIPTEEYVAGEQEVIHRCREGWLSKGADLSHYNSAESAADVADLRVALGYDEWDLYGISYGTRLALTVMRDHPEGVRSVILDSTYPPEVDGIESILPGASRSFSELFEACASDPLCSSTYGDLEALLYSAVDGLNADPADIWVVDFLTFEGYPALLDGDSLLGLVYLGLYSDLSIPGLPQMVADAAEGHYFKAQALTSVLLLNQAFLSIGQFLSVQCHEEVPFSDPAAVEARVSDYPRLAPLVAGALVQSDEAFEFCRRWGAGTANPIENQPVESDIPTLVLAGRFDPITPPEFGRIVAERLENAWYVEFPTLGHGVTATEGCPQSVTLAFLADPGTHPDTSCIPGMAGLAFEVFDPVPDVRLVENRIGPYRVLVPEGWEEEGGVYQRGLADDPTFFLVIPGPAGFGEAVLSAVASAWSGVAVSESQELEIGGKTWRRFSAEAGSFSLEAALHDGDTASIVVALISDPRERDHLFGRVVTPALESLGSADT